MFDPQTIKKDFPIFSKNKGLVYLDSTATSLKPQSVIEKEREYYEEYSANIFRGIYKISEKATAEYEAVREKVAKFIHAKNSSEIIFVRNATEALNLVMYSWGRSQIDHESEVVTTIIEHHANFVPWQILCQHKKATLKIIGLTPEGLLDEGDLLKSITQKTKLVALTHVSNVTGSIHPLSELIKKIKQINPKAIIVVDGAQGAPHLSVNVSEIGCDFYVFSAHKMLGPTGVGVLWARYELLDQMQPYQYGGEMIEAVYTDHTEFKKPPHKFEAGTPNIAGVIGFGATISYLESLGMDNVHQYEQKICSYAMEKLLNMDGVDVIGSKNCSKRGGAISFTSAYAHAHDVAQMLDAENICIRSGHHCAMPLHQALGIAGSARASFYIYNTTDDVDTLIEGLGRIKKKFG